jgi:putative two-component system response regulator
MFILILDDAELNNALMSEAVRGIPDSATRDFTRPHDALAFLEARPDEIGVIVTDFDMPGMNGLEFTRAVKRLGSFQHIPIMMVTSFDQRKYRREALEAGVTDFLGKPFDAVEVRARVTNLLALNRARQAEQDRAEWLTREVAAAVAAIEAREQEIVMRLVRAAEHRDTDTGNHILRVSKYASMIADELGFPASYCKRIALAATMHDIGKLAVPDAILLKRGPLTAEERLEMQKHAEQGFEILANSASDVIKLAAEIALTHHERWDGSGYPRRLAAEGIPMSGRIVAVADVFDALVSARPYKHGWSIEDARSYLVEHAGSQFDPACVDAFLKGWQGMMDEDECRPVQAA